jgi:hypothetical protein
MPLLYVDLIEGRDLSDLVVPITENGDDGWSFGHGRPQFVSKEPA